MRVYGIKTTIEGGRFLSTFGKCKTKKEILKARKALALAMKKDIEKDRKFLIDTFLYFVENHKGWWV